jgi:hypothetical protein
VSFVVPPPFPILSVRRLETLLGRSRVDLQRIAESAPRFYQPFTIEKPGGKTRTIDRPVGELKAVQELIQSRLLSRLNLPNTMYGGVKGRSPKRNAQEHLKAPVVITVDLRECFPRTPNSKVFGVFKGLLGCSTEVASLLTRLTTVNGHIPQGAPTSTTLCNLSLLPLNEALEAVTGRLSLKFTQYIDDIAISGAKARQAVEPVVEAAAKSGYPIRCKKKLIMPAGRRQTVTGVNVNRKPTLPRDRFESIRLELVNAAKLDLVPSRLLKRLRGLVAHANYINPKQGQSLTRFALRAIPGW